MVPRQDELDAIDASGKSGDNRDNFLGRIRRVVIASSPSAAVAPRRSDLRVPGVMICTFVYQILSSIQK